MHICNCTANLHIDQVYLAERVRFRILQGQEEGCA